MMYFYRSSSFNPYRNLAIEEYLLNYADLHKDTIILYLWQNDNTVVIGRNQDAFSECDVNFLNKNNIYLARRKTGGGAVFHDKNNLNFSFIVPKSIFDKQKSMLIIKNAIETFGLNVEISGRNDLLVDGAKFSGNAYLNKKNVTLHHGTILLDTNVEILSKVLTVNNEKLNSKGVKSVKNRVVNLNIILPNLKISEIENAIKNAFCNLYGEKISDISITNNDISALEDEYSDDNWNYGDKKFVKANSYYKKFSFGLCQIKIFNDGDNQIIKLYSDALDTALIKAIQDFLNSNYYDNIDAIYDDIAKFELNIQ